jgi:hypothetical protein
MPPAVGGRDARPGRRGAADGADGRDRTAVAARTRPGREVLGSWPDPRCPSPGRLPDRPGPPASTPSCRPLPGGAAPPRTPRGAAQRLAPIEQPGVHLVSRNRERHRNRRHRTTSSGWVPNLTPATPPCHPPTGRHPSAPRGSMILFVARRGSVSAGQPHGHGAAIPSAPHVRRSTEKPHPIGVGIQGPTHSSPRSMIARCGLPLLARSRSSPAACPDGQFHRERGQPALRLGLL